MLFPSALVSAAFTRTAVKLMKVAPMGDPIEIRVRGYELTLRVEDATKIQVKEAAV